MQWLTIPYAVVVKCRGYLYDHGWIPCRRLPRPVVSVGNLTVGGTGKTPVVIRLTHWLQSHGKRVGILSRGYGRSSSRNLLVSDGRELLASPDEGGDEPVLIARRCPGAIVAVGGDRYRLGRWVLEQMNVDCFLLDDGFQHRALHRDVNLLLVDATDAAGLSCLLPVGRLREPLDAVSRATALVLTRVGRTARPDDVLRLLETASGRRVPSVSLDFRVQDFVRVGMGTRAPVEWGRGKRTLLVGGIGNPRAFHATASDLGLSIAGACTYPDHHAYTGKDVKEIFRKARLLGVELILTTEKDAVKLEALLETGEEIWAARLVVEDRGGARLEDLCASVLTGSCG